MLRRFSLAAVLMIVLLAPALAVAQSVVAVVAAPTGNGNLRLAVGQDAVFSVAR